MCLETKRGSWTPWHFNPFLKRVSAGTQAKVVLACLYRGEGSLEARLPWIVFPGLLAAEGEERRSITPLPPAARLSRLPHPPTSLATSLSLIPCWGGGLSCKPG